ncbi:MAG: hypothetical protein FWD43_04485 [Coriobacteriia bacterium]|nr:hypothetical protein [Coriobacteriia bacterium]
MYTVIKNRVYDTATAKAIAEYKHGSITQTLYRKKTGEYFAHFYDSSAHDDDRRAGWAGKDKIAPYDFETAKIWAELYLGEEKRDELFKGVVSSEETVVMTVKIKKPAAAKLRKLQSETGESVSQLFEKAIACL